MATRRVARLGMAAGGLPKRYTMVCASNMELDPEIVEIYTGQRYVLSPECAREQLDVATKLYTEALAAFEPAAQAERCAHWRHFRARGDLGFARWILSCKLDPVVYYLFYITPISLLLAWVTAYFFWRESPWPAVVVALFPYLALLSLINPPKLEDIPRLVKEEAEAETAAQFAQAALSPARQRLVAAEAAKNKASKLFNELLSAQASHSQRLLVTNFRTMNGAQFEQFLAEVFSSLGYAVSKIGQAGDQGVDLILHKEAVIAVQAKCWNNAVGNTAVQEVFAGMHFHQCSRGVVVTSSTFTRSAQELASRTGCVLVDGNQIPDLIRGRITL